MDAPARARYTARVPMSKSPENPRAGGSRRGDLRCSRRPRADALRARGENPFANDLVAAPLVALGDLRARFAEARGADGKYDAGKVDELAAGEPVHVAGRVVAVRALGKLSFLRLRDRQGRLQLFCRASRSGALRAAR